MAGSNFFESLESRRMLSTFTVTNTADSGAGSLRQAVLNANASPGADTVSFDESLNGLTITLTSGELTIADSVSISGPGASQLTVSGNDASRVFSIYSGVVSMSGLTISNGRSDYGGAIVSYAGQLALSGVTVTQSTSTGQGGGIAANGPLTMLNSTISFNTGNQSGGVTATAITITRSTVSNNTANSGGVAITFSDTLTMINSTVAMNSGNTPATVAINCFGSAIIRNSTIAGNDVNVGLATNGRSVTMVSTIVAGNSGADISGTLAGSPTNNLVQNAVFAGGMTNGVSGNIVGFDPLLGPLSFNGGPTMTMALLGGSPAIDKGLNPLVLPTDQRGSGFARIIEGAPDIGAFEASSQSAGPTVTTVTASHGFGRFIESINVLNTFTAQVSDPAGNEVNRVEFVLNGITVTDSNGDDGWSAAFEMGLLTGTSTLTVTAVDALGTYGAPRQSTIAAAPRPDWLDNGELLISDVEVSGTQGYRVVVGQRVGSVTPIPDFFPDALLGTENFGTFFSGDLGATAGFFFAVQIPFVGSPLVESMTMTWSVVAFDRPVAEDDWTLPFNNSAADWSIYSPARGNIHEFEAVALGTGVAGTDAVFPGFFAGGTVSFTMSPGLQLAFSITGNFRFARSAWNSPPETLNEDPVYTPSEHLFVGLEVPSLSLALRSELALDLSVAAEGVFAAGYSDGAYSGDLLSMDASFRFEPALLVPLGGGDSWYDEPGFRHGFKLDGGTGFTLSVHDVEVMIGYQWDLVISIYLRTPGALYGVSAPVLNFGSVSAENLLATDAGTLFTISDYPAPEEYIPASTLAETAAAAYGDLAVIGYLTEPTRSDPSRLYVRFRQGDTYGPPELITASDHERAGLTISMVGGTPMAMWSQSTIDRITADDLPVEQATAAREIYWSARINGVWTPPSQLTDNGVMDWNPSLAFNSAGTAGFSAWVRNESSGTFPAGTSSEIYLARWNGSAWGAPVRLTSNASRDVSPTVVPLADGRFMVSWSRTSGGVDSAVFALIAADSTAVVGFGTNIAAPAGHTISGLTAAGLSDGRVALAWLENGADTGTRILMRFYDPTGGTHTPTETVANSRISSWGIALAEQSGQLALVFCADVPAGSIKSSSQVFAGFRAIAEPAGTWTRAIPVTRGDRGHDSPGAAYLGDGSLLVSYAASDFFGQGSQVIPSPLGSDLHDPEGAQVARLARLPDLSITAIEVDEPGASAGAAVTLAVTLRNAGPGASGVFMVRVLANGVGEVASTLLELQPGESTIYTPTISLSRSDWTLTVVLDPAHLIAELNAGNNTRSISSIAFADPTAGPGSIPTGAADASNSHRIVAVNPYGQPIVFEESGGAWTVTELTGSVGGSPTATGDAVIWVDPKDNLTYVAAPSAAGLLLFTRSGAGVWTLRNLTTETGATGSPTHGLTQFTSLGNIVVVAGVTADDRIVAFQQTLATVAGGGPEFKFVDISGDLASQGMTTPVLGGLINYVTSWDQWTLAGIDETGQIQAVWVNISLFTTWQVVNLSTITGAPSVQGQLAVTLTVWGGINLAGLDSGGRVLTTWWVPAFGGDWAVSDLTAEAINSGAPLAPGRISGFTTPWGALNYIVLTSDGIVTAYWWEPINDTWRVDPLLPDEAPADLRPTGALTSYSSAAGTLNVFGTSDTGGVLRLWWNPGGSATWAAEDLSVLAVKN